MSRAVIRYADLATYLEESGTTQVDLAAAVGATQSQISRIARGELVPRPALAHRLARYAGIPLDSFVRVYLQRHEVA